MKYICVNTDCPHDELLNLPIGHPDLLYGHQEIYSENNDTEQRMEAYFRGKFIRPRTITKCIYCHKEVKIIGNDTAC